MPARHAATATILAAILTGCGSNGHQGQDVQQTGTTPSTSATPGSVPTATPPAGRSADLTGKVNRLRQETYGRPMAVEHHQVLYTSALRHAIYLNGLNSEGWSEANAENNPPESRHITPQSDYSLLQEEPIRPSTDTGQTALAGTWSGSIFVNGSGNPAGALEITLDSQGNISPATGKLTNEDGTFSVAGSLRLVNPASGLIVAQLTLTDDLGVVRSLQTTTTTTPIIAGRSASFEPKPWTMRGGVFGPDRQPAGRPDVFSFWALDLAGGSAGTISGFPALYTHTDLATRIQAVSGGIALMESLGSTRAEVDAAFVFNGTVWRDDGYQSDFKGFNLDHDPDFYDFDPIDSLWYSRRGRVMIARAALRAFGYAAVDDKLDFIPPYPIMQGRFLGVVDVMYSRPLVAGLGFWPGPGNVGAQAVTPFGTDPDVGGPNQFSGVPIHISLPVAEPILTDIGLQACRLRRVDAAPAVPATWRFFQVYSKTNGLVVPVTPADNYQARGVPAPTIADAQPTSVTVVGYNGNPPDTWTTRLQFPGSVSLTAISVGDTARIRILSGNRVGSFVFTVTSVNTVNNSITVSIPSPAIVPADYGNDLRNVRVDLFSSSSTGVIAEVDRFLRDGEVFLVPVAPLEANARYEVQIRLRTASYDTGLLIWEFETNDKVVPTS